MMPKRFSVLALSAAALALAGCGGAGGGGSRENIRAVGSSTVFPFSKAVAEAFTRDNPGMASPIIESTGTGGGIRLFCSGVGADKPDLANASRRMTAEEFATCQANGVDDITEIQVGMDGIAFASAQGGITMNLTPELVYRALAAEPYGEEQTATNWSDVDPSLPDLPILVYGPPRTSGTRDALNELILLAGCEGNPEMQALEESDEERFETVCTEVRTDGAFVEQGEQDNLIVQKIEANPNAVGVFGYSYLEQNADRVQGLSMNGVAPNYENIASFEYPGARPLYVYVKNAHLDAIPGLRQYIEQWAQMWDREGPLAEIGLVANSGDVAATAQQKASQFTAITAADLAE